jgi:hypothetical protein
MRKHWFAAVQLLTFAASSCSSFFFFSSSSSDSGCSTQRNRHAGQAVPAPYANNMTSNIQRNNEMHCCLRLVENRESAVPQTMLLIHRMAQLLPLLLVRAQSLLLLLRLLHPTHSLLTWLLCHLMCQLRPHQSLAAAAARPPRPLPAAACCHLTPAAADRCCCLAAAPCPFADLHSPCHRHAPCLWLARAPCCDLCCVTCRKPAARQATRTQPDTLVAAAAVLAGTRCSSYGRRYALNAAVTCNASCLKDAMSACMAWHSKASAGRACSASCSLPVPNALTHVSLLRVNNSGY